MTTTSLLNSLRDLLVSIRRRSARLRERDVYLIIGVALFAGLVAWLRRRRYRANGISEEELDRRLDACKQELLHETDEERRAGERSLELILGKHRSERHPDSE